jgi:allophanate hydrolase subunit 1
VEGSIAMKTRYSFGGDERVFVEIDEEMSLDAFFKSLSITNAVRDSRIKGVTEICSANASLQIRFDPDVITRTTCWLNLSSSNRRPTRRTQR